MARRRNTGKFTISAGEVGQFVYCQESWRLRHHTKSKESISQREQSDRRSGSDLHTTWSSNLDQAAHLGEGLRFLVALVITMVVIVCTY
jgi:hypothetical protein